MIAVPRIFIWGPCGVAASNLLLGMNATLSITNDIYVRMMIMVECSSAYSARAATESVPRVFQAVRIASPDVS